MSVNVAGVLKRKRGQMGPSYYGGKSVRPLKKSKGDYQKGRELVPTVGRELKAFDVTQFSAQFTNVAAGGTFTLLNIPVNGPEMYQRVGRKIYMKSLALRGYIHPIATGVDDQLRMILFYDSQPNAAISTVATLIQDMNAGAVTNVTSHINLNNRERFKMVRDYTFYAPSQTFTAGVITNLGPQDGVTQPQLIDWYVKLGGLESVFNATNGGTVADITSGSLYLMTLSGSTTASWSFSGTSRLRFYDT